MPPSKSLPKIEVAASITNPQLILAIRRNISGVTQRLGEIILYLDEDQEISLFEWTATAADKAEKLETALGDLDFKYQDQSRKVHKLSEQLEDLIEAKKEHENTLLEKFRDLLNAKKLKIRDQHRLLASAKVDPRKGKNNQMEALPCTQETDSSTDSRCSTLPGTTISRIIEGFKA